MSNLVANQKRQADLGESLPLMFRFSQVLMRVVVPVIVAMIMP